MLATNKSNFAVLASAMTPTAKTFAARQDVKSAGASDVESPATTEGARVAVVQDDDRARAALAFQLRTAGFQVDSYRSADEFLADQDLGNFDCVVSDIFLARMNGLELQERIRETANFVSIVFVTGRGDLSVGVHAMRAGAVHVLEKPFDEEALLTAIEQGVQRSRTVRMEYDERFELERRFNSLPPRQREVFTLVTSGLLNKQVGAELGISERTVKVHRERLRRKMGADSVAELSRMAGLLQVLPRAPSARSN